MAPELWQSGLFVFHFIMFLHLYLSPFTKVEESFNMQATHDILTYGIPTNHVLQKLQSNFDHFSFPGAVPRTFIGSIILAGFVKPVDWWRNLTGSQQQFLVRMVLGSLNSISLFSYLIGVRKAYGKSAALWFVVIQSTQFHIFYYASRTLPNMFAFAISTYALRFLLPDPNSSLTPVKRTRLALYLLTLATIVFRSELALLLGSECLYLLLKSPSLTSRISMIRSVFLPAVLAASVAGLVLTISIDTYLWQSKSYLWPEFAAFISNVFPSEDSLGASAWGTSPWHWYFTSALPRLLLNPLLLILIPFGLTRPALRRNISDNLLPALTYIVLYSILPHKETRFLFPIIPPMVTCLAITMSYISNRWNRSLIAKLTTTIILITSIITTILSHTILLPLSAQTYPGADALQSLQQHIFTHAPPENLRNPLQLNIHLTNLACQTGITLFLQDDTPTVTDYLTLSLSHQSSSSSDGNPANENSQRFLPGSSYHHRPALNLTIPKLDPSLRPVTFNKEIDTFTLQDPKFWDKFDFVIVEDPSHPIGRWDTIDRIPSLSSSLRILRPDVGRGLICIPPHLSSVVGFDDDGDGVVRDESNRKREPDALYNLFLNVYGKTIAWVYGVVHDILREGWGVRWLLGGKKFSWSGGYWVHFGLEERLYVMRRAAEA